MPHTGEVLQRMTRAPVQSIPLSGSPHTLSIGSNGLLAITGGTLSLVEYGRAGAFVGVMSASGVIPVYAGDSVRITYLVAPAVSLIPQ